MRNWLKKIELLLLSLIHSIIFYINELVCLNNFFTKLHPSKWPIVKKISNNSFCKTSVSFFKTSCNTIARFFGFKPIFKIEKKHTNTVNRSIKGIIDNFVNNVTENVNNNLEEFDQDYENWNNLIRKLESLKLGSTKIIYNFIDSWHKDISCNINKSANTCVISQKSLDALCTLSEATENVLEHFNSLQNRPGQVLCPAKNCYKIEIDNIEKNIRKKSELIKKEINSYSSTHNHCANDQASTSFSPSLG